MNLNKIDTCECACAECQAMCKRPCWGTPQEIAQLIKKGYADRLMLETYVVYDGLGTYDVEVLVVATSGSERMVAGYDQWTPKKAMVKSCNFQLPDGRCELHDLKLKPIEGRTATCIDENQSDKKIRPELAKMWDLKGQLLVSQWKQLVNFQE